MKKIILIVIVILLVALNVFLILSGVNAFGFEIASLSDVKSKSELLDIKIQTTQNLTISQYSNKKEELNIAIQNYLKEKSRYEVVMDAADVASSQLAHQKVRYPVEFLWVKLGNHASKNGVNTKFEVLQAASNLEDKNDLKITTNGDYIGIVGYLYDIEEDNELDFGVEDLEMTPSGDIVTAVFYIKNIAINF